MSAVNTKGAVIIGDSTVDIKLHSSNGHKDSLFNKLRVFHKIWPYLKLGTFILNNNNYLPIPKL